MPSDHKYYGKRRTKKRKFCGNQFVASKKHASESSDVPSTSVGVEVKESSGATPTASKKKISLFYAVSSDSESESECDSEYQSEEEEDEDGVDVDGDVEGYRLVDIAILANNICDQLSCKFCEGLVELKELERKGLASKFVFHCKNKKCNGQNSFSSCPIIEEGNVSVSSVNRRANLAMRCAGGGPAELKTFCGVLNLPPPVQSSSTRRIQRTVCAAVKSVQADSMREAAAAEYRMAEVVEDDEVRNIDASFDGTYLTRGHTSLIGVTAGIGSVTGKVLDTGVLSKLCKSCDYWRSPKRDRTTDRYRRWQQQHPAVCNITHRGSAGSMESTIACSIFARSIDLYKLRYTGFIGDGDVNSYKKVSDSKPYGDHVNITKLECVGHVQKRMGTRLRNMKSSMKGRKLEDGKTIGGKGRLSDPQILQMQQYYGNAIRGNKGDLQKMHKETWAVWWHKASTDEAPYHSMCNINWCRYKQAERDGTEKTFKHSNNLPMAVMNVIKPIFKDLTHPDLLRRCLDGHTQNANESVNSVIWKYCPKTKLYGLQTVETAVGLAVCIFNDGAGRIKDILHMMDITAGSFTCRFIEDKDSLRILTAERQTAMASKEFRRAQRMRRMGREEELAQVEGNPYQRGGY